jgi:hypothetical protein
MVEYKHLAKLLAPADLRLSFCLMRAQRRVGFMRSRLASLVP